MNAVAAAALLLVWADSRRRFGVAQIAGGREREGGRAGGQGRERREGLEIISGRIYRRKGKTTVTGNILRVILIRTRENR